MNQSSEIKDKDHSNGDYGLHAACRVNVIGQILSLLMWSIKVKSEPTQLVATIKLAKHISLACAHLFGQIIPS